MDEPLLFLKWKENVLTRSVRVVKKHELNPELHTTQAQFNLKFGAAPGF
jgi:hypothetical protein